MKLANWFAICSSLVFLPVLVLAQPTSEASQQIVGRWEGIYKETRTSMPLIFRFTSTGKLIVAVPTENRQGLRAYWVNYQLNPKPKPMHIDLSFEGDRDVIQTIVEIPNPQTLKLQLRPTESPRKRPTAFQDEVQFQKVSETAIIALQNSEGTAPLTQLAEAERSTSGEGQFVMTTLIQSAILHRVETKQFAKHLVELGLNSTSTQNYRFQLSSKGNQLILIARPKKAGIKSYIAVISSEPSRDQGSTQLGAAATICQSVRSSTIAPPTPKVSPRNSDRAYPIITCGSGSAPLSF